MRVDRRQSAVVVLGVVVVVIIIKIVVVIGDGSTSCGTGEVTTIVGENGNDT